MKNYVATDLLPSLYNKAKKLGLKVEYEPSNEEYPIHVTCVDGRSSFDNRYQNVGRTSAALNRYAKGL